MELKVLSVVAVVGDVNRFQFNRMCNLLKIDPTGRDEAIESLQEKGILDKSAYRYPGDMWSDPLGSGQWVQVRKDRKIRR